MADKTTIKIPKPKSRQEVINNNSASRIKQTAKTALANYIDSFFNTDGVNHTLLASINTAAIHYITDKTLTDDRNNPDKKKLTIVRMFEEFRQTLPAIIIADTGYEPRSDIRGIGSLIAAKLEDGVWRGKYAICSDITVSVLVISKDEGTTDIIGSALDALFGPMRNIAGGSYIESPINIHPSWVVRLPLSYSASGTSKENITDDQLNMMWYSDFTLDIAYESTLEVQTDGPEYLVDETRNFSSVGHVTPEILCEDTVKITDRLQVRLTKYDMNKHLLVIDNPSVALINIHTLVVTPRKIGKFKLKLLDTSQGIITDFVGYPTVVEKEIRVIF